MLPWIGRQTGRQAMAHFVRDLRALTEPISLTVEDILASEGRAAIVGALRTRINATGKTTATQFAMILTIDGNVVTRFQMLEDSFDVRGRHAPEGELKVGIKMTAARDHAADTPGRIRGTHDWTPKASH